MAMSRPRALLASLLLACAAAGCAAITPDPPPQDVEGPLEQAAAVQLEAQEVPPTIRETGVVAYFSNGATVAEDSAFVYVFVLETSARADTIRGAIAQMTGVEQTMK